MAKRLFHSCRSPSLAAAVTPTTTLLASSDQQRHLVPAPAGAACCRRGVPRRRPGHPAAAACGAGANNAADNYYGADNDLHLPRGTPAYRWLKSSRWHVIEANAYATATAADRSNDDDPPRLKIDLRRRRVRRRGKLHRRAAAPASWSSDDDDSGWFSTDDDEERASYACGAGVESSTLATTSTATESSSTGASGNGASVVSARKEEKGPVAAVAGGFAVVKRSENPRADFRRSMAEMVVGRGIYDADGLEHLLRCFLALNGQRHRRDIVAAFGDVWEAVFADPPCHDRASSALKSSHASSSGKTATVCHP